MDGLTAEDLRLLLNGVGDINVAVLISYTSFNDESGESSERLVKFKRWLWSIVEKMTHLERQDLVSKFINIFLFYILFHLWSLKKSVLMFLVILYFNFFSCRYIFGLDLLHYQPAKMDFNPCRLLL